MSQQHVSHPVAAVLDALRQRGYPAARAGVGWCVRCPGHDDQVASLSVSEGSDGRALLHCHAGCRIEAVLATLDLRVADLFATRGHR